MGTRLVSMIGRDPTFELASALEADAAVTVPHVDSVSTVLTSDATQAVSAVDVVIDFSAPPACELVAPICAENRVAYVVASTGLGESAERAIDTASEQTAILQAANFSLGVNVLLDLAETAARRLGTAFEIEISEIHHRHKRDAPSGTALALRDAVVRGRGNLRTVFDRSGTGDPRAVDEVGVTALRGGDVSGEHTVYLFGDAERIELTHRATSPDIFARGALRAAAWLAGKSPGRYGMRDVLGIRTSE